MTKKTDTVKKIAGYTRVSSLQEPTAADSLEAQEIEIRKYVDVQVNLLGWEVEQVGFYVERGRSAKDQNRPELQRLKRDVAAGRVDVIVCFRPDRITRSQTDFEDLTTYFADNGVTVVCLRAAGAIRQEEAR